MPFSIQQRLTAWGLTVPTLIGMSAVLLWASTVGLYREVSEYFGPIAGAALIFTASAIAGALQVRGQLFKGLRLPYIVIGGALFVTYETAFALAIGMADNRYQALEVGMINYLWPTVIILLSVILRMERLSGLIVIGMSLSLFGIIWIASGDEGISLTRLMQNASGNPAAYICALEAAIFWPIYTIYTRAKAGGANGVPLFFALTAASLWVVYGLSDEPALQLTWRGLLLSVGIGVLTVLAYMVWNYGVIHGNLTLMATASYFSPVLSVLVTSIILSLTPGLNFWLGAGLVTMGSLMCWRSTQKYPLNARD